MRDAASTTRKLPQGIRQRGERYQARVFVREDRAGKQITKARSFRTLKDAKQWMDDHKKEIRRGTYIAPSHVTVSEFASDWLAGPARTRLRPWSLEQYEQKLRTHVLPILGDYSLSSVTLGLIDKLYASLAEKGISPRTIQYVHAVLNSMFTHALRGGLLAANPCHYATRPKVVRQEQEWMSPQEMSDFLDIARDDPWLSFWTLFADTGARPCELLALRWCNVKGTKVKIVRGVHRHKGAWVFTEPKNRKHRRTITIPEGAVAVLRQRKKMMRENGAHWNDEALIFATESGDLPDYRGLVRHHFDKYLNGPGRRRLTPYSIRHGHMSGLLAAGEAGLTVAHRAGTSIAMINATYGHTGQKEDEHAAETFEQLRRPGLKLA